MTEPSDPTPAQIRRVAARIRRRWSPAERARRRWIATHDDAEGVHVDDVADRLAWTVPLVKCPVG